MCTCGVHVFMNVSMCVPIQALGSLYFFHSDLQEVELWDCNEGKFLPLSNDAIVVRATHNLMGSNYDVI